MATGRRTHRGGASERRKGCFSLEDIHQALGVIDSVVSRPSDGTHKDAPGLITVSSITSRSSSPFNDALHKYLLFARPKEEEDLRELVGLVGQLAVLCGTSTGHWKIFLLVAFHRRYHAKAPAAKNSALLAAEGKKDEDEGKSDHPDVGAEGDGERLVFYVTCLALRRLKQSLRTAEDKKESPDLVAAAVNCMVRIAPEIGGTRDINALTEHLCFESLVKLGHLSATKQEKLADVSEYKSKLLSSVHALAFPKKGSPDEALEKLLDLAAALLDGDLEKCHAQQKEVSSSSEDLMSTIHVMLPHHDRGNKEGRAWQRNLVNCIAEILIWKRTSVGRNEDRFSQAVSKLRDAAQSDAYDCVLQMQTTARKKRKILNDRARADGSLLCSQYLMDRTALSFRQVRRAKAGDLAMLQNLASKFKDNRVLNMIMKRCVDPAKATCIASLGSLISGWHDTRKLVDDGSIEDLELKIQAQTVRATVDSLRAHVGNNEEKRSVLVSKLGRSRKDAVCAILVAAAIYPHSRLLIEGEEVDLSSEDSILELLNAAVVDDVDLGGEKSAEAIIKEDLKESQDVVFLSSSDIQLDEALLRQLHEQDKTIRVHSSSRVDVIEPLKVELKSEIHKRLKSGMPLSVTVLLDCTGSMGGEISGCKKGALKTIDMFNDLAPVKWVNFVGYWDPVNSRRDPDPRSTGYINPSVEGNLEKIQAFVDTQLPCTGGGDEPEDIPAALEKLLSDMKDAGLSENDGVHFTFFIADAGYRPNEDERVAASLEALSGLGVVMVMCPVRSWGTCNDLVAKIKSVFYPGQYIELGGVSQLESIAATVTESVRASLFDSGNVASVTASVGETFEAISQLCSFQKDHASMKRVEELSKLPPDQAVADDEAPMESTADEPTEESGEKSSSTKDTDNIIEEGENSNDDSGGRPVFAEANTFSLTNLDRIYLQISKLPSVCHQAVEDAFGGKSLQEVVAADIARRLVQEGLSITDLHESGYPSELITLVRGMMGGHGTKRV